MKRINFTLFILLTTLLSCSDKSYQLSNDKLVISGENSLYESSAAGNLMATAIQKENELDIVLYPTQLMDPKYYGLVSNEMKDSEINEILSVYPTGVMDQFKVGTMKGRDIKKLITQRSEEKYTAELDVAGIKYHIHYVGGMRQFANFSGERKNKIDDGKYYKVAVSHFFFFNGKVFPGYRLRNGLTFSLKDEGRLISARESLTSYLRKTKVFANFKEIRAKVSKFVKGNSGPKKIYEIQGKTHLSPIYGTKVKTSGIITAISRRSNYPGGVDLYIQDKNGDNNDKTSDAVHVYLQDQTVDFEMGDEVEVSGVVYEEMMRLGLSRTSIRDVTSVTRLASNQPLPAAVVIGSQGRSIPKVNVSTYRGNLNSKPDLKLADGVDFYESLEGMRVAINEPRIVGFNGGNVDSARTNADRYISLYLLPDGKDANPNTTPAGGLIIDSKILDHNPELLIVTTNHMTNGLDNDVFVNVGDQLEGRAEGVLGYEKNTFGDGQYVLNLPVAQDMFSSIKSNEIDISKRPKAKLVAQKNKLTVATYNIENLGGNLANRLTAIGESIANNLKCPDIVNLVEIQDDNGIEFSGSSSAAKTLERLIGEIKCEGVNYEYVNIDPILHGEGGQPGGNIRVAMIYNSNRVSFTPKSNAGARTDTIIGNDGSLSHNPARVAANARAFKGTRKSLVAEFEFKGEKVFVIGNHFNSKRGDTSFWTNVQPPIFGSEQKRALLAAEINKFVQMLTLRAPKANIVVLGDFNANIIEKPMMILEGDHLKNLVPYGNLIPETDRYTTSHNGNSQPLDYIFVNKNLLKRNPECEILHFNSDYMGRLSDHDPVISRFTF